MTLAADQQAMLGLLLEKGQSYADLGTLLGIPEAEVRERARAALTELGGADPDRTVGLTDYLLGQADPIGRADAVRHLRDDPGDRALAERLLAQLQAIAPGADLPKLPGEPRTAPHLRAPKLPRPGGDGAAPRIRSTLSQRQTRLIVAVGVGAAIAAVVVLAIAGVFSGGGSSSSSSTAGGAGTTASSGGGSSGGGNGGGGTQSLTPIRLKGVGGSPGVGLATFGLATGNQPYLDVRTRGLPQAPSGQVYSVWLVVDPARRQAYPVAPLTQNHQQFQIPAAVTPILTSIKAIDVSVSSVQALRSEIKRVLQAKKPKLIIPEIGNVAMRGVVPAKLRGHG
jgi:hypothetical protein